MYESRILWRDITQTQPCRDIHQVLFLDGYGVVHAGRPCWGIVNDDVLPEGW